VSRFWSELRREIGTVTFLFLFSPFDFSHMRRHSATTLLPYCYSHPTEAVEFERGYWYYRIIPKKR
jgi:hypothetical protein